jgi:hypothetical protein
MRPPAKSAFVRNENEDPVGEAARIDGRRIEGDKQCPHPDMSGIHGALAQAIQEAIAFPLSI